MGLKPRNILLAGGSGLVGGLTLRSLLGNRRFTGTVFAPSRRELGLSDNRLLTLHTDFSTQSIADVSALVERPPSRPVDSYISCLGTTIKTAGSREAFIAVDRDLVVRLAQLAFDHGAGHAILVSSVGASRQSGTFYLRVKGEVEDALAKIGFNRLDILRPGLLLGGRTEQRPGEALAQVLAPLANQALFGKLRRYRSIEADSVARAIVRLLEHDESGRFTHLHDAIRSLSG